jgi:RNA polymerase sigma factor (sigma-70 family)
LARLPLRQRAVIVLRYFEDLSESDIATQLGWPIGTVKSTASRALAAMQRSLCAERLVGDPALNE